MCVPLLLSLQIHLQLDILDRGRGLFHLKLTIHKFKPLPELSPFEYLFFMETPTSLEAHVGIYDVSNEVEGRCVNLFSKY